MRLSSQGNLGIGTTSPAYKLDVRGDIYSSGYVRGRSGLCIGSDCRTSWPSGIDGSGSANKIAIWQDSDTLTYDSNLHWDNTNNRLGIGDPTPDAKLDVSGGDIYVDSGKGLRSETGDLIIDAHSTGRGTVYMYDDVSISGNLVANGYGSFNGAEQWTNFVTSKTGYGDTIGIGGDNSGNDIEIRVNAPSTRNTLVLWNSNLNENVNFIAKDIRANGDISWGSRGTLSRDQGGSIELGGDKKKPYIDFSNDDTSDYDMRIQLTGDNELSIQGGSLTVNGNLRVNRKTKSNAVYVTKGFSVRYDYDMGPSSSADNQWHTAVCPAGYAMHGVSVWASSYFDGWLTAYCVDMSEFLNTSDVYWTTPTSNQDNTFHSASCPYGYVATGIKAYATTYLDYGLSLQCTGLKSGFEENLIWGYDSNFNQENVDYAEYHAFCPAGSVVSVVRAYATSHLDYFLTIMCSYISW